jgi:hypothetical protein
MKKLLLNTKKWYYHCAFKPRKKQNNQCEILFEKISINFYDNKTDKLKSNEKISHLVP